MAPLERFLLYNHISLLNNNYSKIKILKQEKSPSMPEKTKKPLLRLSDWRQS